MFDVSVIICTRNRATQLSPCLDHVRALVTSRSWELIVVDNGSADQTAKVVEAFAESAPFLVKYVFEPICGLSRARNAGVASAEGALIMFTDDDCYVARDWIETTAAAFEDPEVGFVSGRVLLYDPTDYPTTISLSTTPIEFSSKSYIPPGVIKGANMAFRRSVIDQIDGFDTLFGAGSYFPAEDCDAAARASLAGWKGRYVPESVLSHHHGRKAAEVEKLFRAYDRGRGAYHMKLWVKCHAPRQALRGWRGLARRVLHRPATLRWEMAGALGYLRIYRRT